jgi:hypothetical protein
VPGKRRSSPSSTWASLLASILAVCGAIVLLVGMLVSTSPDAGLTWFGVVDSTHVSRSIRYDAYGPSSTGVDAVVLHVATPERPRRIHWTAYDAGLADSLHPGDRVRVSVSDTNGRGEGYGIALERGGHLLRSVAETSSRQRRHQQGALITAAVLLLGAAGLWALGRARGQG